MAAIGLDIGTTRCKASFVDQTGRAQIVPNRRGDLFTPSAIFFEDGTHPIVGVEALAEGFLQPEYVHTCFKRVLGSQDVLYTDTNGKTYTATDFQAILIKSLKEDVEARLNEVVDEAVITVPANFQDHKKQATIDAAKMAGIKTLKLLHEPTAAGLAHALDKKQDQCVVVYDLGGGTFDVSVLETKGDDITVLTSTGREKLGGEDFNQRIETFVVEQFVAETGYTPTPQTDPMFFSELAEKAEPAKIALSDKSSTRIVIGCQGQQAIVELTRSKFEQLTKDLLQETLDCTCEAIAEIGRGWDEIDVILLVGGAVRMPAVEMALAELTGIAPRMTVEPDRAVCYGAALQCAIELAAMGKAATIGGRAIPTPKAMVREVTTHGVGCCVVAKDGLLSNAIILPKGTSIPTAKTDRFALQHDGQTDARVEILQGEEGQAREECLSIGHVELKNLPPEARSSKRIEVTYAIDHNGMITARGRDLVGGEQVEIRIDYSRGIEQSSASQRVA